MESTQSMEGRKEGSRLGQGLVVDVIYLSNPEAMRIPRGQRAYEWK